MNHNPITYKTEVLENKMQHDGVTLLTYKIEYPLFSSDRYQLSIAAINRYYRAKAQEYQRYCEETLFPLAVEQYKDDVKNEYPVRVFEVMQTFQVTLAEACVLSLYFDRYEYTGGAHGNTVRSSQTWNLQRNGQIRLEQLYRCPGDYKAYFLRLINEEIAKNPELYFENYKELTAKTFHENSFYCTPDGVVIYYQQYDIAPYSSGIREFLIPYGICVVSPLTRCFKVK